ncbi:MAG: pyridoxal phosphate-dependent aminotransferase [Hyphomicrobiaceae bacterium]|nr:pyridoxal phosphate-dependent aminotransferase [Hyphomicrobiaceae bacterium]
MTRPKVTERVGRISTSPSAVASQRARELRAEGHDMLALSAGEPDFQTPPHVIEAAHRAMLDGQTKYTSISGTPELKTAIQEKFRRENGLAYETDEIIVSTGAKQVIYNAVMATVEKGDEVIIPAPYWISYEQIVQLVNGTAKVVPCSGDVGFKLSAEALEGAITPQTRLLMINTPSNPSGAVYTEGNLKELAEVLRKHPQIWILTDDIYEHIVFDGRKAATMAVVAPDLKDRTITVNGVSKAYSMTGFRIGFAGAPKALTSQMVKVQSQSTSGTSSVGQAAALAALTGPQDFIETCRRAYQDRRDLIVSMLNQTTGITCRTPEGAFYAFPDCAGLMGTTTPAGKRIETDQDLVMHLMDDHGVALVHGAAYGMSPNFRVSFAASMEELEEAGRRIQTAANALVKD